ncbi:marine proteobacterial sortase target protein [Shewanella kaireitica]|uniref:marine proteobacterial sortase target protein n=1 Tax=Shewanella kaireitica TaxID=212021 RepID=UPI00200E23EC|nr:marine proteobacterial sortase target protein [Shewanella kaireitica]MCL1094781.1 marine proteobacterial sortase target protein [Shewanella kaireitica]
MVSQQDPAKGLIRHCYKALLLLSTAFLPMYTSATAAVPMSATESVESRVEMVNAIAQGSLITYDAAGKASVSLPMKTTVNMQVSGWVNRVSLRHEFSNEQLVWVNGEYLFPLPNEAAVDGLRMFIGERVIEGEIKPKAKAKALFNEAKQQGKKASLLQQKRPNIFSADVANLAPGETLIVELNYQELVHYDKGEFSLRFPMVAAPRYKSNAEKSAFSYMAAEVNSYGLSTLGYQQGSATKRVNLVDIEVTLDAGMPIGEISSPYHQIEVSSNADSQAQIQLTAAKANSDFVLNWRPIVGSAPKAAIFSQQGKTHVSDHENKATAAQSQYSLVMLLPPQDKMRLSAIAPRELILVIDTSGSMSGEAIEQAKASIIYALSGLSAQDSFNILQFNSNVYALSDTPLNASAKNIGRAQAYVQRLQANGGTEMSLALDKALSQQDLNSERLRQVLFITDGAIGNEPQLFTQIRNQLQQSRLFTIGIGAAPNAHFMQRAAELGRGTYTYIGKQSEVKSKMVAMLDKLEKPAVTDIEIHFADGSVPDYWPASIPDLYAHEPIMVAMKLPSFSDKELVVSGQLAGQFWQQSLAVENSAEAKGLDLIWARKQIAALELSKEPANRDRIEKQVTAISLNYHVMSAYTSLVAIDKTPVRPVGDKSVNGRVLPHTPKGWQRLPQTATSSYAMLIFGGMLILLSLLYWGSFSGVGRRAKKAAL